MKIALKCFELLGKISAHRFFPAMLAIGAIIVMLPALRLGLGLDDLPQRAAALKPGQSAPGLQNTGLVSAESGSLRTVVRDFFFNCTPKQLAMAKSYGLLPWWTPSELKLRLWRPVTAFTHWLEYRLYPNRPVLMHAQNIAWYAGIMFLLAVIYRKLMGAGPASGLAALLFLLDGNTYFPVAFVANRGFIMSLFFGLACLYEHHQWRSVKSSRGLVLSSLFLALSVFANEGGVSTFAFILAYALVLEPGSLRNRLWTILPSVLVIVLWRTIYTLSGFGLDHVGAYIDPSSEPFLFGREVIPRAMVLLGAQVIHIAPDLFLAIKPSLQTPMTLLFGVPAILFFAACFPLLHRNKHAAFWFAVMVLAAIPAATVLPLGKNLGFVAVGAYGLIAIFITSLFAELKQLPATRAYRIPAWGVCGLLLLVHVPGAVIGRIGTIIGLELCFPGNNRFINIETSKDAENKDVVVINAPCSLTMAYAPFYKDFYHEPVPKSMRSLVPGCTDFNVQRTDDKTLTIKSKAPNVFSCGDFGPVRSVYIFRNCNLLGPPKFKKGDRYDLGRLSVEILELDASDLPACVAFHFDASLDSPAFEWLVFDWSTRSCQPFKMPAVGQGVTLDGPRP